MRHTPKFEDYHTYLMYFFSERCNLDYDTAYDLSMDTWIRFLNRLGSKHLGEVKKVYGYLNAIKITVIKEHQNRLTKERDGQRTLKEVLIALSDSIASPFADLKAVYDNMISELQEYVSEIDAQLLALSALSLTNFEINDELGLYGGEEKEISAKIARRKTKAKERLLKKLEDERSREEFKRRIKGADPNWVFNRFVENLISEIRISTFAFSLSREGEGRISTDLRLRLCIRDLSDGIHSLKSIIAPATQRQSSSRQNKLGELRMPMTTDNDRQIQASMFDALFNHSPKDRKLILDLNRLSSIAFAIDVPPEKIHYSTSLDASNKSSIKIKAKSISSDHSLISLDKFPIMKAKHYSIGKLAKSLPCKNMAGPYCQSGRENLYSKTQNIMLPNHHIDKLLHEVSKSIISLMSVSALSNRVDNHPQDLKKTFWGRFSYSSHDKAEYDTYSKGNFTIRDIGFRNSYSQSRLSFFNTSYSLSDTLLFMKKKQKKNVDPSLELSNNIVKLKRQESLMEIGLDKMIDREEKKVAFKLFLLSQILSDFSDCS